MPGSSRPPQGLLALPAGCLSRIAGFVLSSEHSRSPEHVTLTPGSHAAKSAITLARTHPLLRKAAAAAVVAVDFRDDQQAWPAVRAVGSTCWPSLREVRVVVDRSRLVGFLKWLVGTDGLEVVELRVVGARYAKEGLVDLEKMLLGRLFMQTGLSLVELSVEGVDTKALLMSAVCRCSKLQRVRVKHYDASGGGEGSAAATDAGAGATEPTLVWYIFVLLCLVNKESLVEVEHPFREVLVPDGKTLQSALDATWGTLWGNYRAGAKVCYQFEELFLVVVSFLPTVINVL